MVGSRRVGRGSPVPRRRWPPPKMHARPCSTRRGTHRRHRRPMGCSPSLTWCRLPTTCGDWWPTCFAGSCWWRVGRERLRDREAATPAGEIITAVSYRGGKAADPVLEVQARIRDAEDALDHERQAALKAAEGVERIAIARADLTAERQAILTRLERARTAAG